MDLGVLNSILLALTALFTAGAAGAAWATVQQARRFMLPALVMNCKMKGGTAHLDITNSGGGSAVFVRFVVVCGNQYEEGLAKGYLPPGETASAALRIAPWGSPSAVIAVCRDSTGIYHVWSMEGSIKRCVRVSVVSGGPRAPSKGYTSCFLA